MNISLNIQDLPKEIQDKIRLKEESDPTFYRFADEPYTEIFMDTIAQRSDVENHHSLILSTFGGQGSGKCIECSTSVVVDGEYKFAKDIAKNSNVIGSDGKNKLVNDVWFTKKTCYELQLDGFLPCVASEDHKFELSDGSIKTVKDLKLNDLIKTSVRKIDVDGNLDDYKRGFFIGAYLADGTGKYKKQKSNKISKKTNLFTNSGGTRSFINISNNDVNVLNYIRDCSKLFEFVSTSIKDVSDNRLVFVAYGAKGVENIINICGDISENKRVPAEIFQTKQCLKGFIDGFTSCDMTCNISKTEKLLKNGKICVKHKTEVGFLVKSKLLGAGLLDALHCLGFWPNVKLRVLKSGKWVGNKYVRMTFPAKMVESFLNSLNLKSLHKQSRVREVLDIRELRDCDSKNTNNSIIYWGKNVRLARIVGKEFVGEKECVDISIDSSDHLFLVCGGVLTHNSWSMLSICRMLDPNFDVQKNIYFDYNKLVYDRASFKPGMAILVDEQSQSYGLDSHRVMIILASIKEQLRKRSIHLIFCAPVLYEESKSSMYIIETQYIDKEEEDCIAALKTREGQTLGHIRIPSPLKQFEDGTSLFTREEMELYEQHKDEHLDRLLGANNIDEFEERAQHIIKHPMFMAAEKIYKVKMGYVPQGMVVQIINKIFPEYNAGVVPWEIAQRIKLNKEIMGEWQVAGAGMGSHEKAKKKARK